MENIALYMLKTTVCSAIFMSYYWLFLRNGRFYSWNRFYLLFTMFASLLIPFINIPVYIEQPQVYELLEPIGFDTAAWQTSVTATSVIATSATATVSIINLTNSLILLYALVVLVLVVVEIQALVSLFRLRKNVPFIKIKTVKLYYTNSHSAPFSLFNTVFWRNTIDVNSPDGQRIFRHELAHIKAKHTYDKLLTQLVCTLLWVNPVFWLVKRELNLVHEFAADNAAVADNDTQALSALILCSIFPNNYLEFTNQFFQSSIKRRITMLRNNQKIKLAKFRQLMGVTLMVVTLCAFAVTIQAKPLPAPNYVPQPQPLPAPPPFADTIKTNTTQNVTAKQTVIPYMVVDVKPLFKNESANKFPTWVSNQIQYPEEAVKKEIQGVVYIGCTIGVDGKLSDIRVLRPVHPLLDAEALRVVQASPEWTPGKNKGKVVPVSFQLPVKFQLPKDKKLSMPDEKDFELAAAAASEQPVPFMVANVKPLFQNDDAKKFPTWVNNQIQYPEEAVKKEIQGIVYIGFTIGIDGKLSDIRVLRPVHPLLDAEALRVVQASPEWTPGKNKGKVVPVSFQLPVRFQLPKNNTLSVSDNKGLKAKPNASEQPVPFMVADVKPLFQNDDANKFPTWVNNQIQYPEEAVKKEIQGVVYIWFTIGVDGKLSDIRVLRAIDPLLDAEALRVVQASPEWTPGKHKGKVVPVSFQLPVRFQLPKDKKLSLPDQKELNPNDANSKSPFPFAIVDEKPLFQNDDANKFPTWVQSQLRYPKENVQGTIVIGVVIGVDGKLSDIKVLRSAHPLLDAEVVRVVKLSPDWTPGKLNGVTVPVSFNIPVKFKFEYDQQPEPTTKKE